MTRIIRVLHVFHGMDCGGAESMIMNIYRQIDRTKVQFDFLVHTNKKCYFDDEIKNLGGTIIQVPYYNLKNQKLYTQSLKEVFDKNKFDIVHGHLGSCAHIYLNVAKYYGCFTIAHSHSTKPPFSFKETLYRYFTFKTRRVADYFIGCSDASGLYRYGKNIFFDKDRYSTLTNAIDTKKYIFNEFLRNKKRKEFNIDNDVILVGHVGRFDKWKNQMFVLEVYKEIRRINKNVKLILVGDGDLKESIEKAVINLNLENEVIFTGVRNDVNELMMAMDVFLFPSVYEGLPVTLVEAQATDLPCVISDVITNEVSITDLINYKSLQELPVDWANTVLNSTKKDRKNRKEDIIQGGYDINTTTKWITDFYMNHRKLGD